MRRRARWLLIVPALVVLDLECAAWAAFHPLPGRDLDSGRMADPAPLHCAPAFPVYALVLGIVIANQALAALAGPVFLRYAPSKIVLLPDDSHHLPHAMLTGSSWSYHRAFVAEQLRTTAFAKRVEGACDPKTLVVSLEATQIFADLYPASTVWNEERGQLRGFLLRETQLGGRTIWVLSENEGWPDDPVADVLADPALGDFKLVRDPNNISIYDHAVIPPDRVAHFGCASE